MSQPIPISDTVASRIVAEPSLSSAIEAQEGDARGHSYDADKARIQARLKRIEGQVRGISRMIDEDKYCIDILTQISAVMASTRSVGLLVLEDHIKGCVMGADPNEREATLDELNLAIERFVRSVGN